MEVDYYRVRINNLILYIAHHIKNQTLKRRIMETIYINYKTQRVSESMPGDMTNVDRYRFECDHRSVTGYSKIYRMASLEEPAEYTEWAVCNNCGETLDWDDVPEYAEIN